MGWLNAILLPRRSSFFHPVDQNRPALYNNELRERLCNAGPIHGICRYRGIGPNI